MSSLKQGPQDSSGRIPRKKYESLVQSTQHTADVSTLRNNLDELREVVGGDFIELGLITTTSYHFQSLYMLGNTGEEWQRHYTEQEYQRVDPRIHLSRTQVHPVVWNDIDSEQHSSTQVLKDLAQWGMHCGMTFAAHLPRDNFGFIHLSYDAPPKKQASRIAYITPPMQYMSLLLCQQLLRLVHSQHQKTQQPAFELAMPDNQLSDRERVCLVWSAEGRTTKDIATILDIAEATVNNHLNNICDKLEANNRSHAIAKAISLRLIAPEYRKKIKLCYLRK